MMFARSLRTRVRTGGRCPLLDGHVEVTGITEVDLVDITDEVARRSGFESREALFATARHGRGERVFIVDFVFSPGPPAP